MLSLHCHHTVIRLSSHCLADAPFIKDWGGNLLGDFVSAYVRKPAVIVSPSLEGSVVTDSEKLVAVSAPDTTSVTLIT